MAAYWTPREIGKQQPIFVFCRPMDIFPTNQDPANILGKTDFHSGNLCFCFCFWYFSGFQIPRFPGSQIPDFKILVPRTKNHGPTPSVTEDLMPRGMTSEPRHWMEFGHLVMSVQCSAEALLPPCLSTALHRTHRPDQVAKYHPVPWLR